MIAVDRYKQKFMRQWHRCPGTRYILQNSIPEKYLNYHFTSLLKAQISDNGMPANMERFKRKFMPEMRAFATEYLMTPGLDTDAYCTALSEFVEQAKTFDKRLNNSDIYQAGRNVLTMYVIQDLLDLEIALTPSIFAYSLLYPYTDNYLDNPRINLQQKERFNDRLAQKLSGTAIPAENEHENIIFTLIDMIEQQYPRSGYPQVYQSLLLIHRAQCTSIKLFNNPMLTPSELLEICFEKGGASVLADGFLVAGTLTHQLQEYLFGIGIYLQLLDDLQDMELDIQAKISTLFAHYAKRQPIDTVVNRFLYFSEKILESPPTQMDGDTIPNHNNHRKIIQLLFLNTAGKILPYFSCDYQDYLQSCLKN
jgi:hypothetical protein